jgi:hypothetical protein
MKLEVGIPSEAIAAVASRLADKDHVAEAEVGLLFGKDGVRLPIKSNLNIRRRLPDLVGVHLRTPSSMFDAVAELSRELCRLVCRPEPLPALACLRY